MWNQTVLSFVHMVTGRFMVLPVASKVLRMKGKKNLKMARQLKYAIQYHTWSSTIIEDVSWEADS